MRTWTRAGTDRICGFCRDHITPGKPILVFRVGSLTREHIRCGKPECAGERVPDGLPPLPERVAITPTMPIRVGPGMLPLDFKKLQGGDQ